MKYLVIKEPYFFTLAGTKEYVKSVADTMHIWCIENEIPLRLHYGRPSAGGRRYSIDLFTADELLIFKLKFGL